MLAAAAAKPRPRMVTARPGAAPRGLKSIKTAAFDAVLTATPAQANADAPARETHVHAAPANDADPRAFLLRVMNDERVEMALRIEAAKALLR